MPVFSHSRDSPNGTREGSKLLIDHLKGVKDKAVTNLFPRLSFSDADKFKQIVEDICWLHDLGKYTRFFQTYLLTPKEADWRLKTHSAFGAHTIFKIYGHQPEDALIAFFLIRMHHSNLLNIDKVLFPDNNNEYDDVDIFHQQANNLLEHGDLNKEFPILEKFEFEHFGVQTLYNEYKKNLKGRPDIERYFKVNYIFSLLIEADKIDASDSNIYQRITLDANAITVMSGFGKPDTPTKSINDFTQNELRNFVRDQVTKNIERFDILEKRLFTLAAPTGIGKTITALDFALRLRKKIEQEENYFPQIIYALPFINIIEQALAVYEKALPEAKIIAHYQFADVFGKDESSQNGLNDYEGSYSQKRMEWDTWQSDVVITSFVQFFETLIGNRNKLLKKFHHLAGAIIILDEVQTLGIEKLPLIGAALTYLTKFMNARVLVMTATQPKLFDLMKRELPVSSEEFHEPLNLLKHENEVFECFNRTKIVPIINEPIEDREFLNLFLAQWKWGQNCLIVVNKVQRSIDVFNLLHNHFSQESVQLFYLSTNITPAERQHRVNSLKNEKLSNGNCILVSTQVVEAGVDLDFDIGFRDLGPIDSIVQVAGRVNRENSPNRKNAPVFVVDFGDCKKIYGYATDVQARMALKDHDEIPESGYKKLVESYFEKIADKRLTNFNYSKEIFNAMKGLQYAYPSGSPKKNKTVSDFEIIEQKQVGVPIFVELSNDPRATKARTSFQELMRGKLNKGSFDKEFKRDFNQRIIAVPSYLPKVEELKKKERLTDDILWINADDAAEFYDADTGFIRGKENENTVTFF